MYSFLKQLSLFAHYTGLPIPWPLPLGLRIPLPTPISSFTLSKVSKAIRLPFPILLVVSLLYLFLLSP